MRSSGATHTHRIAYFISPHGFGHAARAAGVMAAMQEIDSTIRFEIFTRVPRWFFEDSLAGGFGYHAVLTDIGLVQKTSLLADLPATLRRLQAFLPFDQARIIGLARRLHTMQCALVLCDIAPMGIAVAKEAGLPSVLIENFTWDWIYHEYAASNSRIVFYINYLQELFAKADYHLQIEPVCSYRAADLITRPVSRKITTLAAQMRDRLAIPHGVKAIMITMGGIPGHYTFVSQLAHQPESFFVIPGAASEVQRRGNVLLLPHHSAFFHPDLVNACDAVIGKAGYSTVAEVYYAGIPFGYVTRQAFRESPILAAYIAQHMQGVAISQSRFHDGSWLAHLPELLALPRLHRHEPNGADQVARFICQLLHGQAGTSEPKGV
jgi:UDP:flavonoid glycosyltransferase YjiC (YdhE family)